MHALPQHSARSWLTLVMPCITHGLQRDAKGLVRGIRSRGREHSSVQYFACQT